MKKVGGMLLSFVLVSCGGSESTTVTPSPQPSASPGPGNHGKDVNAEFVAKIKPTVDKFCTPCHAAAGFVKTGTAFKSGKPQQMIASGAMPKAGSQQAKAFTDQDKQLLLSF
jgi:hypothetical protein